MSGSTGGPPSTGERAARVQRLKAAVAERKQAREHREAGKGASPETQVDVSVQAAGEQLSARKRRFS